MSRQVDPEQPLVPARSTWCTVVLLAMVLVLTGCGQDPATVADPAGQSPSAGASPDATASAQASTAQTTAATPSTDKIASPSATPSSDDYRYENFATPSGNIRCSMVSGPDGDGVRCDIGEKTWESPPKDADCEFDWGNSLYLTEEESGFDCVSDAIDPVVPLPYGETKTLGRVECSSRETGVRCEHLGSGHGFELSRARYSLF